MNLKGPTTLSALSQVSIYITLTPCFIVQATVFWFIEDGVRVIGQVALASDSEGSLTHSLNHWT